MTGPDAAPRRPRRWFLPELPGVPPVLGTGLHLGLLGASLLAVLAAVARAAAVPGAAAVLTVAWLAPLAVLAALAVEHVRFLRVAPRPPAGAVVLAPHPAGPREIAAVPGRPGRRSTRRGVARRARLWADPSTVGVVSWLHDAVAWPRAQVRALRIVRLPDGAPYRVEILGERDTVHAVLEWPTWFADARTDRLRTFAHDARLAVEESTYHPRRTVYVAPADASTRYPEHTAARGAVAFGAHAAALGMVGCVVVGAAGHAVGAVTTLLRLGGASVVVAAGVVLVLAVASGWNDQRAVP